MERDGRIEEDVVVHVEGFLGTEYRPPPKTLVLKEDARSGLDALERIKLSPPTLLVRLATAHDAIRELMVVSVVKLDKETVESIPELLLSSVVFLWWFFLSPHAIGATHHCSVDSSKQAP